MAGPLALSVALAASAGPGPLAGSGPGPLLSAQQDTTPRSAARLVSDSGFVAEPSEWEQYVRSKRLEIGVPALAIAAATPDQVLFAAVAGVRSVDTDGPAEVGDGFHIGSVAKPITGTMVARLVEKGVLRWETTPSDVWPEEAHAFDPQLRRITVEQLLSHRAGMPSFESDEENATFEQLRGESPREERARFARWLLAREASFPVGEHVYSNAGYGLVAAMAEAVTGLRWRQLIEREVFTPLEMSSCGFGWPAASGDQPSGHRMVDGLLQPHDLSDGYRLRAAIAPAGDIYCSIEDLVRFGKAHLQGLQMETDYLGRATFQKMHEAPHGEYALGWNVRSFGSHHLGSAGTFAANLIVFRDADLVTAVATNTSGSMTSERFSEIASYLYRSLGTPRP